MIDIIETKAGPTVSRFPVLVAYLTKNWVRCLLLAIVGFVARLPALQGEQVWDDDYLVRTNAFIKSPLFILEVFRHYLFQDTFSAHYRPVQNLSYMADYLIWNSNFYGYHLTSLLLHLGSGVLLYLLLRKLVARLAPDFCWINKHFTGASWVAFFAALLWLVHPVHSAAVDYVSGRADSLAFGFGCAAWLLFLKGTELEKRHSRCVLYASSAFCALLSLCSRESGCVWIALFLLYLLVFEKSVRPKAKWMPLLGCVVILGAYGGLRTLAGPSTIPKSTMEVAPSLRTVLMFRALGDYGRLLVFPSNLHMERTVFDPKGFQTETGRFHVIEHEYLSIGGLLFAAALLFLCLRSGPGQRTRVFGAAWFILAYLPMSNLIDLNATVAEHWLYLPSVGFFIFLGGCAIDLSPRWQRACVAFACVAAVGLSARSMFRSSDWVSNEVFARRTIASGGATIRVILLLGQVYANRGDHAAAEHLLRKAVQLSPEHPTARNNLADALFHQGKTKEADALFTSNTKTAHEAMKEYPRTWIAALNLSNFHHSEHNDAVAIQVLEKARQDYPNVWELIGAESELLREADQIDASLNLLRPFAQNNWWHYRAWAALGRLLAQKGDVAAATAALKHASRLDVHETAALNLIALMQMRENHFEEARRTQRRAVAREPDQPRQYLLLSDILDKMGRKEESRAALAQVSRLRLLADAKSTN